LIESDAVSQPLDGGRAPLAGEARRVPSAGDDPGERRVASLAAATVEASETAGVPQDGQNRAASGTAAPQRRQGTGGFYAGSLSER
jgi:hypothetical protein